MGVLQGLASHSDKLFAAWKGEPDDDRLFYASWSGQGAWQAGGTLPGNSSVGPSLASWNGSLYAAWKGEWSDPRLFFAKLTTSWQSQAQVAGCYSEVGPAICGYGNALYAAWKDIFDTTLMFASYDGQGWTAPKPMSSFTSSVGPSLATFDGKMFAAWKDADSEDLWFASYANGSWGPRSAIPHATSSVGPALAGVGDDLWAVWKGGSGDEALYSASYPSTGADQNTWSTKQTGHQVALAGIDSSAGAAIAQFGGKLYAMAKGQGSNVSLYTAELTSASPSWSPAIPGNTGPDPVGPPVTFPVASTTGFDNYVLADSGGTGAAIIGTTVSIIVVEDIVPQNGAPYSIQLNVQSPATSAPNPFVWQQYMLCVDMDEFIFRVNHWRNQDIASGSEYINWDSRGMPNGSGVVPVPGNILKAGSVITATLVSGAESVITGFQFTVTQPGQPTLNSPVVDLTQIDNDRATQANLASNLAFSVAMLALLGGVAVTFTSGKAIFQLSADNNLSAGTAPPGAAFQTGTGETSNATYAPLPATYPNGEFYQPFGLGAI